MLVLIAAWMFLPVAEIPLPGFLDLSKQMAACGATMLGVLAFDAKSLASLRLRWFDATILFYCCWPGVCAVANGFGLWDGVSATIEYMCTWGIPYFVGRVYFADESGQTELLKGLFIAGLLYVPLCLIEMRISPQLHSIFYGYHPSAFDQTFRLGGWRPVVFMQHGLAVALWMCVCSLAGFWLWKSKQLVPVAGMRYLPLLALWATTLFTRSMGALALTSFITLTLVSSELLRTRILLILLLLIAPAWVTVRSAGLFDGAVIGELAESLTGDPERRNSFDVRLDQENAVRDLALSSPVFGHGRWGLGLDQRWLLEFRNHGAPQLAALVLLLQQPLIAMCIKFRPGKGGDWDSPGIVLAAIPTLFMLDNLLNGMENPVFPFICGATTHYWALKGQASDSTASEDNLESQGGWIDPRPALQRRLHRGHAI
ncbi:hypothetical protein [Posidoniimonas polymericola]|uniref:hypothetical protein n=1 Tax=Posidoniimonas polymericola TaxID=2528002 RepID=UPI0011B4FB17|nr:hypothetical protein [Posidoniimonas polymericola]